MTWLVVTPARNEAVRLPRLAASLVQQSHSVIGLWVVVDDGSTDGTDRVIDEAQLPFPFLCLRRENSGGLLAGSEFAAFFEGVEAGLRVLPRPERIMKLDADIELEPEYFHHLLARTPAFAGLVGGVLTSAGEREQLHSVRGALKAYSPEAWQVVARLPPVLGLDVLDEIAIRQHHLEVLVVPQARARTSRRTGTSEGNALHGRRRNGIMCRWTGYHPAYFLLRFIRTVFRRPFGLGALTMAHAFLTAGRGPFPEELRQGLRTEQVSRMRALALHPVSWLRETYQYER